MSKQRIVVAMHSNLVPPDSVEGLSEAELHPIKQEYDVCVTLEDLGHDVIRVGVDDELAPLRRALREHKPHVVFNLLTHFHDAGVMDSAVVSWLELIKQPYTGCNPRGLLVASDKALSKKVLSYHRIRAPRFMTVPLGRAVPKLPKNLR
ncbi:MAG: D-alanine--D-alanine ligase, partial [Planctomycetota bacterium]